MSHEPGEGQHSPRIQQLAPDVVRVTHFAGDEAPSDRAWLPAVLASGVELDGAGTAVTAYLEGGCVHFRTDQGQIILAEAHTAQLGVKRSHRGLVVDVPRMEVKYANERTSDGITLAFALVPGEAFYGWGEWFNAFCRTEGTVRLQNQDAFALVQDRATYSGIPFFLSSRGYGIWLLNSHTAEFAIRPEAGLLEIQADGPPADYILFYGPSFKRIIFQYTALTGRPPLIPRWAFGLFVTGYPQEHQDVVVERVLQHRRRNIPLDAVILDYHWEAGYHNFRWREALFPKPDRFIAQLAQQYVRLGIILTPFVNRRNRPLAKRLLNALAHNLPPGLEKDDERALPEYEEARAGGYLAHPDAKWWFGQGGMIDFTHPEAAAWWNAKLEPLYEQGVAFVKNDDGEYLPPDGRSALGMEGREYHNLYGFFYGRALYDGMAARDDRRPFIYARSVWAGSQRYPALFLGDQKPTFAHLAATLRAGLNLGLLGFAYWTPDVFGLDGKTTSETHMRYAQWALLAPVARYFWRPPYIDDTRFPWSHSPEVETNFRKYAELRYRLLPYYYQLAWETSQRGLPIIRPLLLEFPDDPRLAGVEDQYLLGDRLLVAPVLEEGATLRRIVLPEGTWHDYWSERIFTGPGVTDYPAPLDCLPLLVRGGTVLPLGPSLMHIDDDHRFAALTLHCYPPYPAEGILYEDDGRTRAYLAGVYDVTSIQVAEDEAGTRVTVTPATMVYNTPETVRALEVVLHRAAEPAAVRLNGEPHAAYIWDAENSLVSITCEHTIDATLTIEIERIRPE